MMPTNFAPSSVAFGSHQRCGAPCKVAKRPLFPHLGEGFKMRRLSFEILSFVRKINHNFTLNFYYLRSFTYAEGEDIETGIHGGVKSVKCDIIWGASGVKVDIFG